MVQTVDVYLFLGPSPPSSVGTLTGKHDTAMILSLKCLRQVPSFVSACMYMCRLLTYFSGPTCSLGQKAQDWQAASK